MDNGFAIEDAAASREGILWRSLFPCVSSRTLWFTKNISGCHASNADGSDHPPPKYRPSLNPPSMIFFGGPILIGKRLPDQREGFDYGLAPLWARSSVDETYCKGTDRKLQAGGFRQGKRATQASDTKASR